MLHYSLFVALFCYFSPRRIPSGWGWRECGNDMDLHLDTPQSPRVMVIPLMETERDWQQESACGFCHFWGCVCHYWGGFIIIGVFPFISEFPNINCQGPQSCLQGSGSARGAKGTPTHMETAKNEQDTENMPKSHPKHLRHSKPRQNRPISNTVCKGEIHSCVEEAAQEGVQPWQISIIPLRSILLGQQVGINQIFMDLKELRGFGLSLSSSAQPSPKASNEKQKEKGTKAKETKRNLHISSV